MAFARAATISVMLAIASVLWVSAATAQDQGTPEEAQAMAEAAAALVEAEGADAAFDAFTNGSDFQDRDLYVFVIDGNGDVAAHGGNANLVGRNMLDLRDPTGNLFIQAMIAIDDSGWVDYHWQNPATGNVEPKTSYVVHVGDYWLGVGAYTN